MWFKLNDEQAKIYDKLKGSSVSRNYDIRKALVKEGPIPPPPTLNFRLVKSAFCAPDKNDPFSAIMKK